MCLEQESNPHSWDDEPFRALMKRCLNHSAAETADMMVVHDILWEPIGLEPTYDHGLALQDHLLACFICELFIF